MFGEIASRLLIAMLSALAVVGLYVLVGEIAKLFQ